MKSKLIKTHDLREIYLKSKKIINKIKKNPEPFFLQINTWRYVEHCGPNFDDDLNYRKKNDQNYWLKLDQIKKYKSLLRRKKIFNDKDFNNLEKKIKLEINNAFQFAEKSKYPSKKLLTKYIYK